MTTKDIRDPKRLAGTPGEIKGYFHPWNRDGERPLYYILNIGKNPALPHLTIALDGKNWFWGADSPSHGTLEEMLEECVPLSEEETYALVVQYL